jgi:calcium-dependent protein kinase
MSCIQYCHNNNICHRDLKPENLLYLNSGSETDNRIKVIDFGLSQHTKRLKTKVGTAYYVSPEILTGKYTELCDIWSAGVILYILLSGVPPFNGPSDQVIYQKIMEMKFTFPENQWKYVSKEAKDLLCHMLAPEKNRYNAERVLKHPWFKNANSTPITSLQFNINYFLDYIQGSSIKKMALMFIASRLDENEINNLKNVFSAFDKGKDGQISYEELKQGLIQLKSNRITEQDVIFLFKALDVDHNGKIDYSEFIAGTLQRANYYKSDRLMEAFTNFDKDKSGKISKDELIVALKAEKSQEKEIEKLIKQVDKNNDGKIDYNEFLALMQNQ